MKKTDFIIAKQNNVETIKYELKVSDVYDDNAADKASALPNILSFDYTDVDGKRTVTAYAHEDTNLESMLKRVLSKKDVLCILSGLSSLFEIGTQGIPVSYLVKDFNLIYVNTETYAVKCVVVPVKQDVMPLSEIPAFFREVVSKMRFSETDTDNYVAKLITEINADDFSVSKLKANIDSQLEAMGLFISKDNGLVNMAEKNAQIPAKDVKVNKLGVMNNMRQSQQMMGQPQMAPQGQPMMGQPQMRPQQPMMGQPQMAPQGQPMMGQPQMAPQGQPMMGQPQMAPQGQPMMGQPQMAPQGQPMMGQPQMAPQGQPMMGQPQMRPQGQPMMGQPQMAPQGQPMMGQPQMAPQGQPMMAQPQMAPQGQRMMGQPQMAPQGQPMMGQPQMAPKPVAPEAPKPVAPEVPKPVAPEVPKPVAPEAPKPVAPEAPKPVAPEAPKPVAPEAPKPVPPVMPNPAVQMAPKTVITGQIMANSAKPVEEGDNSNLTVLVNNGPISMQPGITGQIGTKPIPHLVRKNTGEIINITKPEFSIGKSKTKADYAIENNTAISRVHCIIVQRDGVNYIKDNGSTNHTFINGIQLEPGKEVLLKNKTIIRMGDEEFTFLLRKGE